MTYEIKDTEGNAIRSKNYGGFIHIVLYLKGTAYPRKLGRINTSTNTLIVDRKRAKHLHLKSNSYGFNHSLLAQATRFDKVQINDETGSYIATVEDILTNGKFLFFKQVGFEKQIFYPINQLTKIN